MANELQSARIMREIIVERDRQIHGEGFSREHDDHHRPGNLARAGAAYAMFAALDDVQRAEILTTKGEGTLARCSFAWVWPWPLKLFKPKAERRRELVIGAAFLVAEIEKLDRADRRAGWLQSEPQGGKS